MPKQIIDFREELSVFNDLNITRDTARQVCETIFESLTNEDKGIKHIKFYPYWDTREFHIYFIVYNTHYNMPLMGDFLFLASIRDKNERKNQERLNQLECVHITQK